MWSFRSTFLMYATLIKFNLIRYNSFEFALFRFCLIRAWLALNAIELTRSVLILTNGATGTTATGLLSCIGHSTDWAWIGASLAITQAVFIGIVGRGA